MPVVETRSGKLEGIERSGGLQFRGIPFAAAPAGERRWHPPAPPDPWTGVRRASEFGPIAPQSLESGSSVFPARESADVSEEGCLTLNVFTTGLDGDPRPVLVWIHGGGFTASSARIPWYNGTSFATQGVVVVTIQYRLGALGFLHLDDLPGSGNCGLLDQVAALEWVRDNIAAFGGDPGRVTIFGESAGGMSVGSLLGMPAAAGLFRQAVPQSGAASNANPLARAQEAAEHVIAKVGGRDALRTASWERIVAAQGEVVAEMTRGGGALPFMPVVDGAALPALPLESVRAGSAAGVPLLTGTNRDEMTLFLLGAPDGHDMAEDKAVRRLERTNPGRGRALYDAYRTELGAGSTPGQVWVAVESDRTFRLPAIRLASAQARHTPDVWMYLFTWESPILDGVLGSTHALEIPFVWNTLSSPDSERFTGGGPAAEALAGEMHATWSAFAAGEDLDWDRYEEGRRATRIFGPGAGVVDDPRGALRRLWE